MTSKTSYVRPVEQYIASLPKKELTPISNIFPMRYQVVHIKKQALGNLATFFSTLASGPHSWSKLLQTDGEFHHLHGTLWFKMTSPIYPVHANHVALDVHTYKIQQNQFMFHTP